MANPEHLQILKQGGAVWNAWRESIKHFVRADLREADLSRAHLGGADLSRANLCESSLVATNLEGANLTGCQVYGISAWNINLVGAQQSDLVITDKDEPVITVDNLEVAQFIYLLLHNEKIREVIDTVGQKGASYQNLTKILPKSYDFFP
jgi:pentapeptide repeat protein